MSLSSSKSASTSRTPWGTSTARAKRPRRCWASAWLRCIGNSNRRGRSSAKAPRPRAAALAAFRVDLDLLGRFLHLFELLQSSGLLLQNLLVSSLDFLERLDERG